MNVGSLFSGIGGMDAGLARAGFTHRFFCESDEWRRTVLAHHWPGVPIYDDVRNVGRGKLPDTVGSPTSADLRRDEAASGVAGREVGGSGIQRPERVDRGIEDGDVGFQRELQQSGSDGRVGNDGATDVATILGGSRLDLLVGGFPCQDLSVAGNRAGLAGSRSGLFYEFARIIDALRPRWVLIENVPGLLSSNGGRDFGIVLGTLADLGYGVAWRTLDSRFFGVPQRRRRVFVLATVADGDPRAAAERAGEVLAVGSRCTGHSSAGGEAGADVASTLGGSVGNGRGHDGNPFDWGGHSSLTQHDPVSSLLANGGDRHINDAQAGRLVVSTSDVSMTLMAKKGKSDDPELESFVTHAIAFSTSDQDTPRDDGTTPPLKKNSNGQGPGSGPSVFAAIHHDVAAPLTSGGHPNSNMPGRRKEDDVNLAVTHALTSEGADASEDGTGRGTPLAVIPISGDALRGEGTAKTPSPDAEGRVRLRDPGFSIGDEGDPAFTISSTSPGAVGMGVGVRRLTPTECERLQALPDGWTAHGPDSRRYSALGDAVTASVSEWIGRRLIEHGC